MANSANGLDGSLVGCTAVRCHSGRQPTARLSLRVAGLGCSAGRDFVRSSSVVSWCRSARVLWFFFGCSAIWSAITLSHNLLCTRFDVGFAGDRTSTLRSCCHRRHYLDSLAGVWNRPIDLSRWCLESPTPPTRYPVHLLHSLLYSRPVLPRLLARCTSRKGGNGPGGSAH